MSWTRFSCPRQVLKALADQDHPYSKYSTGNLKTLKDDVPEVTEVPDTDRVAELNALAICYR